MTPDQIKSEILRLTQEYARVRHQGFRPAEHESAGFHPGVTAIPYAGRVFTEDEVEAAVSSALDFWLTLGPEGDRFSSALAEYLGVKQSLLVNSGSSANLVALATLTSPRLKDRRLVPGDEVITCAAGFPTTVAPILQLGCVPVFIDNDPVSGNLRVDQLEAALSPRTRAVMAAHTLGNPMDLGSLLAFCRRHGLWLIEDNCDALGSTYTVPETLAGALGIPAGGSAPTVTLRTGAWGDLSTQSFYPPHHLTLGEGGGVNIVHKPLLGRIAESIRDWGRDCWCPSGHDNTCTKRFDWQLGELPHGYDHKYIYSHLGYNLKPLDLQAAIGLCQLRKLPGFVEARRRNWDHLRRGLAGLESVFDFSLPTHATGWTADTGFAWDSTGCRSDCSWFGFMLRVKHTAPFSRRDLARHLDARKIGNRMLFGGNLVRQPVFVELKESRPESFRVATSLEGADTIMNEALFIGVYPGLSTAMLDYMVETVRDFVGTKTCTL